VAGGSVQGQPDPGLGGRPGFEQLVLGQLEVVDQLTGGRRSTEKLVQFVGDLGQPQHGFLARSGHVHPPAGVAQVAFEFPNHQATAKGTNAGPLAGS
jgi:hypothetical protein